MMRNMLADDFEGDGLIEKAGLRPHLMTLNRVG